MKTKVGEYVLIGMGITTGLALFVWAGASGYVQPQHFYNLYL